MIVKRSLCRRNFNVGGVNDVSNKTGGVGAQELTKLFVSRELSNRFEPRMP